MLSRTSNILKTRLNQFSTIIKHLSHTGHQNQVVCKEKLKYLEPCCRVSVVTGGAEGIGLATAHQLLCRNAEHVVLIGTDMSKGLEAVNSLNCAHGKNKATFIKCDIKCKDMVEETLMKIKSDFERVEIFVNCAGIWNEQDWEQQMQTNLKGTIYVNRAVQKLFDGGGCIINLTSEQGLYSFPISPIYCAEQAAIIRYTQSYGDEMYFKKTGMRTVALCTGITCTDYLKDLEDRMVHDTKKLLREYLLKAPLQKPDVCGKSVIELIKFAPPGSIWLVEGSRLFALNFPDWKKSTTLVSQFT